MKNKKGRKSRIAFAVLMSIILVITMTPMAAFATETPGSTPPAIEFSVEGEPASGGDLGEPAEGEDLGEPAEGEDLGEPAEGEDLGEPAEGED
ncbi:MAG: hypothetical protein IJC14_00580, partial [Firmicutes bacterium]|nr:hypothetical protein [Bacillota bacterium]